MCAYGLLTKYLQLKVSFVPKKKDRYFFVLQYNKVASMHSIIEIKLQVVPCRHTIKCSVRFLECSLTFNDAMVKRLNSHIIDVKTYYLATTTLII